VKTQFGWHVIKVEDKRQKPAPTFDEVKPQLEAFVTRKAQADLVTKLRADAKVEKFYKTEGAADDKPKQ
jgi:peptidyl-prolyl cis-trans isomerase C